VATMKIDKEELEKTKEMILNFQDPIRGKVLFLIAAIENELKKEQNQQE
jgi:hypothetical protein